MQCQSIFSCEYNLISTQSIHFFNQSIVPSNIKQHNAQVRFM
jgi:hypothetical protein